MNAVAQLAALLGRVGAVVTLDYDRSTALPCVCCGTTDEDRTLVTLGRWAVDVGARGRRGDPIDRPVCLRCREEAPRG